MELQFFCPEQKQVFITSSWGICGRLETIVDASGQKNLQGRIEADCPFCLEKHVYGPDELPCPWGTEK